MYTYTIVSRAITHGYLKFTVKNRGGRLHGEATYLHAIHRIIKNGGDTTVVVTEDCKSWVILISKKPQTCNDVINVQRYKHAVGLQMYSFDIL